MVLYQGMVQTQIKVLSEIIMRIGLLLYLILWNLNQRIMKVNNGQSVHSLVFMMVMVELYVQIS